MDGRQIRRTFARYSATLLAEGVRYARIERLGLVQALVPITVNLTLGLVIVALKVAFDH